MNYLNRASRCRLRQSITVNTQMSPKNGALFFPEMLELMLELRIGQ
jgi:hypothetical protein